MLSRGAGKRTSDVDAGLVGKTGRLGADGLGFLGNAASAFEQSMLDRAFFDWAIVELAQTEQAAFDRLRMGEGRMGRVGLALNAHKSEMYEIRRLRRGVHEDGAAQSVLPESLIRLMPQGVKEVVAGVNPDAVGKVSAVGTVETHPSLCGWV